MVCGARDASPEALRALAELARAAIRAEDARRAALDPAERAAEDARRAEGRTRLDRIRRRAVPDEHEAPPFDPDLSLIDPGRTW